MVSDFTCPSEIRCFYPSIQHSPLKDNVIHNMAWWLKSAGALNFALSQEQCPISL